MIWHLQCINSIIFAWISVLLIDRLIDKPTNTCFVERECIVDTGCARCAQQYFDLQLIRVKWMIRRVISCAICYGQSAIVRRGFSDIYRNQIESQWISVIWSRRMWLVPICNANCVRRAPTAWQTFKSLIKLNCIQSELDQRPIHRRTGVPIYRRQWIDCPIRWLFLVCRTRHSHTVMNLQ